MSERQPKYIDFSDLSPDEQRDVIQQSVRIPVVLKSSKLHPNPHEDVEPVVDEVDERDGPLARLKKLFSFS